MVSHMTYVTGLVTPVKELADLAHRRGLLISVDGAHPLGMMDPGPEGHERRPLCGRRAEVADVHGRHREGARRGLRRRHFCVTVNLVFLR